MLSKFFTALTTAAVLAGSAGVANAGVTFVGYNTGVPVGEKLLTSFSTSAGLVPGYTGMLVSGTLTNHYQDPAYSATLRDPGQYLAVSTTQYATYTLPSTETVSIYIGSLDSSNKISFLTTGGTVSYTGSKLQALTTAKDNGDATSPLTNGWFTFTFTKPVESVTFTSGIPSIEVADIAAAVVPEPASWAMMVLGLGLVGFAMRRRNVLAAAI
jgi:hypothetical protein